MRVVLVILILLINFTVNAQYNIFEKYDSWSNVLSNAEGNKNIIALYFGANWCTPCKQLEKNVFIDSGVINDLKGTVSFYKFDIDESPSVVFLKKFRITSVPIIVLLDSNGNLISRIENIELDKTLFVNQILASQKQRGLYAGVSKNLAIEYPDFYNKYFDNKMKLLPDSIVVESYLRSQEDLFTEVNWGVLTLFNSSDYYLEFILTNRAKFASLFGPEVPFKIFNMYTKLANKYIGLKDSLSYNRIAKVFLEPQNSSKSENSIRTFLVRELKFLGLTGIDWEKYIKKFKQFNSKYGVTHNHFFLNYAYNTEMKVEYAKYLVDLFESVTNEIPTPQVNFEYGVLCVKAKLKKMGFEYFDKCINKCTSDEERTHFTDLIAEFKKMK